MRKRSHMGQPTGAPNRRVNSNEVAVATLRWAKVSAGAYHATSPFGLYTINGNNAGRNRWTVTYPDGDYGMCDALAEAKAWAESDVAQRAKRAK